MPKKCSRCGARHREDPECGKGEHLALPPRPRTRTPETEHVENDQAVEVGLAGRTAKKRKQHMWRCRICEFPIFGNWGDVLDHEADICPLRKEG